MVAPGEAGEQVRLTVPAEPGFGRIARLTASGLALRHGFGHGEVEELRTAVDEAIGLLVNGHTAGQGERLAVTFRLEPFAIAIQLHRQYVDGGSKRLGRAACNAFTHAVEPLVDSVTVVAASAQVRLVKHRLDSSER